MSDVLVVQNARLEGPGTIGDLLRADGFKLQTVFAKKEKIPPLDHLMVLVLGAPESANDDLWYLQDEIALMQESVRTGVPLLGICLGSQLLAKALGARVYPGSKKEIGFYRDLRVDTASKSRLFDGIDNPFTVFHWHGDTFDIPNGAQRLVYSDLYNQAFRYGSAVGVQFHLEVDGAIIRSWIENTTENINLPYIDTNKILLDIESEMPKIEKNVELFYKNFRSELRLTKV